MTQLGASIEYVSSVIDKCYKLSSLVNISKEFQEKIEDGQQYAKGFRRSDAIVQEMIKEKKSNFNAIFEIQ